MKHWKSFLITKITVDEYYIRVIKGGESLGFKIRYVRHNGYTHIQMGVDGEYSPEHKKFGEWLFIHQNYNTRYNKPHWYKPIRFGRQKKIINWALEAVDEAYAAWFMEELPVKPQELQKAS